MTYRKVHLGRVKESGFAKHLVHHLLSRCQESPQSVLDVGCGAGGYTKEWVNQVPNGKITALDKDPAEINGATVIKVDLKTPRYLTADVVFSKSVLEHLDPQARAGFLSLFRVGIRKGGTGFIMVPDWKTCMDVFYDDYTHVMPYTQESLKDLLAVHGMEASVEVFWQVPFSWKHPNIWRVLRKFWWLVRDPDLQYRMKHAALLAVIKK